MQILSRRLHQLQLQSGQVHVEQFPEKYEGKVLKVLVEDKKLIGGGGGKVHKEK